MENADASRTRLFAERKFLPFAYGKSRYLVRVGESCVTVPLRPRIRSSVTSGAAAPVWHTGCPPSVVSQKFISKFQMMAAAEVELKSPFVRLCQRGNFFCGVS